MGSGESERKVEKVVEREMDFFSFVSKYNFFYLAIYFTEKRKD